MVKLYEILNVNLVVPNLSLLATEDQIRRFQRAVEDDFGLEIAQAFETGPGEDQPTRILRLDRERITLSLPGANTQITKAFYSPVAQNEGLDRFAQIIEQAFNAASKFDGNLCSYGYNSDLVFDQEVEPTAFKFLGERLFKELLQPGQEIVGGFGHVVLNDSAGQWTYRFEPRFGNPALPRLFVSVNLHKERQAVPGWQQMSGSFRQILDNVQELMVRLSG